MISKFWWVNFILSTTLVLFAVKTTMIWQKNLVLTYAERSAPKMSWPEPMSVKIPEKERGIYDVISEKNLFNDQRREHIPKEVAPEKILAVLPEPERIKEPDTIDKPETVKILEKKDLILYGVILMENYKIAFVNDLENEKASDQIRVKEKDRVAEYTIEKIFPASIIVSYQDTPYRVPLFKEKPRKSASSPKIVSKEIEKAENENLIRTPMILDTKKPIVQSPVSEVEPDKDDGYEWVILSTPFGEKRIRQKK